MCLIIQPVINDQALNLYFSDLWSGLIRLYFYTKQTPLITEMLMKHVFILSAGDLRFRSVWNQF